MRTEIKYSILKIMEDDPNKDDKGMTNTILGNAFEFHALLQYPEENVSVFF